ncbi:MAG: SDR family NAD(P)-dependent oxidoreductase [Flavobacteriales bacterium]|nr:SDR family NAD(P)-dependent oxidoreductase [Flavobacteriales bacterium]
MKAIVTGATRGIGREVSKVLAGAGYSLAMLARNQDELDYVRRELKAVYPSQEFLTFSCDLSDAHATRNTAHKLVQQWPDIDVMVLNAGMYAEDELCEFDDRTTYKMLEVNALAAARFIRAYYPYLEKRKKGHIFILGSIVQRETRPGAFSYSLSKHALNAVFEHAWATLRVHNVRVTQIIPGSVNTSSWDGQDAPIEKFVQPEDIARLLINTLQSGGLVKELIIVPSQPGL